MISNKNERLCCIGDQNSLFFKSISDITVFSDILFVHEREILNFDDFIEWCKEKSITQFLFPNPYGNEKRLAFYLYLRATNSMPYLASDRGALPDSWFFDPNGFNADSSSYHPENWDHPLLVEREGRVESYIKQQIETDVSLEKQGAMLGPVKLREKLGVAKDKKILFVPLQRPSDTVIKYFSGNVVSVDDFLSQVIEVRQLLLDEWVVLVKQHPLEVERRQADQLLYVDDDTHFKDLLGLCDAVLLINSGVGVTAMMYQKPVYYFGDAFYAHPEINQRVSSASSLIDHLKSGAFVVNFEKVKRFISYLIEDFYSFGNFLTQEKRARDGAKRRVTTKIDFTQVKNLTLNCSFDVLLVTDVKFWLCSAGNQARIYQLLLAIQKKLRVIVFFIGSVSEDERLKLDRSNINVIVKFSQDVTSLDETFPVIFPPENLTMRRFYSDSIVRKFFSFVKKISFRAVIVEYIKFDYLFDILDPGALRIIDTHDLFFQRARSYRQNNDINFIEISEDEEIKILKKYDYVISIQRNEKEFLDKKIPKEKNLLIPHFVPGENIFCGFSDNMRIGFVSSPANLPHLDWFVNNVWCYFRDLDNFSLNVYGAICKKSLIKKCKKIKNLFFMGCVPDVKTIYQNINLIINPVRFGSGLKIKNVEALAHGIPLITTHTGMQGMEDGADNAFLVADTVDEWIDAILMCKLSPTLCETLSRHALEYAKEHFSENIYDTLVDTINLTRD